MSKPGDTIIASTRLYGGSITQFGKTIHKFGWRCVFVDTDDIQAVRTAVIKEKNVKLVWAESLANPGGVVTDITALADAAHSVNVPLVIDNTMATPYLCRPFEHGADLVVHSTTKFLSGHGNAMGGAGKGQRGKSSKFPLIPTPYVWGGAIISTRPVPHILFVHVIKSNFVLKNLTLY